MMSPTLWCLRWVLIRVGLLCEREACTQCCLCPQFRGLHTQLKLKCSRRETGMCRRVHVWTWAAWWPCVWEKLTVTDAGSQLFVWPDVQAQDVPTPPELPSLRAAARPRRQALGRRLKAELFVSGETKNWPATVLFLSLLCLFRWELNEQSSS